MQTALRFLQLVHNRLAGPPAPAGALTFDSVLLTFDGVPITFQPA